MCGFLIPFYDPFCSIGFFQTSGISDGIARLKNHNKKTLITIPILFPDTRLNNIIPIEPRNPRSAIANEGSMVMPPK
jgi:hypothetical protein